MSIELRNITKRYGQGAIGALDTSLVVNQGEFVALFGPSGSGKTSMLHLMGLLQEPDEGEVLLEGQVISGTSEGAAAKLRRTKLGFVFQSSGLLALLSAEENVEVALRLLGEGGRKSRRRVEAALEAVEMLPRASHRPEELSGG
ncbi:MAG: ATP-binding cassette domain-containing protein, partial [Acidimicrobiia bacterium]|nr:ATP-binding cassette domain-containing protein [Acidimicrobiia bacterium]